MHLLPNNLATLANVTGTDGKFGFKNVLLKMTDSGFEAASTDCKMLMVVTGPLVDQSCFPNLPQMEQAPKSDKKEVLVDAKEWKKVFQASSKLKGMTSPLQSVAVEIGEEVTSFAATNLSEVAFFQSSNVDKRFPPYEDVISPEPAKVLASLTLDVKLLHQLCAAVLPFANDHKVKVEITKSMVFFSGEGENGQSFKACLMGMA